MECSDSGNAAEAQNCGSTLRQAMIMQGVFVLLLIMAEYMPLATYYWLRDKMRGRK
jgi:hypothetical protein